MYMNNNNHNIIKAYNKLTYKSTQYSQRKPLESDSLNLAAMTSPTNGRNTTILKTTYRVTRKNIKT